MLLRISEDMSNNGTFNGRRKYDDEFKRDALKMIDSGQSVRSVAQSLGVGENLLHKWKQGRRAKASGTELEMIELRGRVSTRQLTACSRWPFTVRYRKW